MVKLVGDYTENYTGNRTVFSPEYLSVVQFSKTSKADSYRNFYKISYKIK